MIAIAEALRSNNPQGAETLATQMMATPNLLPLDNAYLHMNRGLAREKLDRREDALTDFTAAIDAKVLPPSEQARALFDRGVTLDEMGRTEAAIADYSQAIVIVPRYATALNNRGNAYRRLKKFELAQADYEAALGAGDDEPEFPLYGLGRIAEAQSDAVQAQSFYNRALAANAGYTPASDRIAKLTAVSTPANYTLHEPDDGPAVQVNLPAAAPTEPVTQAAPQIDLHPPASEPLVDTAARKPHPSKKADTVFSLRPAILYDAKKNQGTTAARVASLTPPKAIPDVPPPSIAHSAVRATSAMIQLGAWHSEEDAANGWNRIVGRSGGLLNGMNPSVVAADIPGKGRFWRLRAEPSSGVDAASLCEQLKAKGLACIVAKG